MSSVIKNFMRFYHKNLRKYNMVGYKSKIPRQQKVFKDNFKKKLKYHVNIVFRLAQNF